MTPQASKCEGCAPSAITCVSVCSNPNQCFNTLSQAFSCGHVQWGQSFICETGSTLDIIFTLIFFINLVSPTFYHMKAHTNLTLEFFCEHSDWGACMFIISYAFQLTMTSSTVVPLCILVHIGLSSMFQ